MGEEAIPRPLRVLVVDDNESVRAAIVGSLAKMNDVELLDPADSGERGLDFALERNPDVVLRDVSMPGIGGIEATRRLKASLPSCRVIGFSTSDEEDAMRAAGAEDFVHKGDRTDRLIRALRRGLD